MVSRSTGDVRVSSLQTGAFAGPVGSRIGQHRFSHPTPSSERRRRTCGPHTPLYGSVEVRGRASDDPCTMVALWMIGYEDEPERSAELCVCEIFGRDVGAGQVRVGVGLHPFDDPALESDFSQVTVRSTPASCT